MPDCSSPRPKRSVSSHSRSTCSGVVPFRWLVSVLGSAVITGGKVRVYLGRIQDAAELERVVGELGGEADGPPFTPHGSPEASRHKWGRYYAFSTAELRREAARHL